MNSTTQNIHRDFLSALITGNRTECSQIAKKLLNNKYSLIELYETIIKQSLYEVGELWEYNKISVATEHMATSIAESILNELYDQIISDRRVHKKIVVACVENEFHQGDSTAIFKLV